MQLNNSLDDPTKNRVVDIDDTCYITRENDKISEFKLYGSLNAPKFQLEDNLGNKVEIIAIQVAQEKYSFKIIDAKTGLYILNIFNKNTIIRKQVIVET
jgi:hypothetical protein